MLSLAEYKGNSCKPAMRASLLGNDTLPYVYVKMLTDELAGL
jgi:hypothetical protein